MAHTPRVKVTATKRPYTVVLQTVDPPEPVIYINTPLFSTARYAFDTWKAKVKKAVQQYGSAGEWELIIYKHTPQSKLEFFRTNKQGNRKSKKDSFVYSIYYKNSEVIDALSYCSEEVAHW